MSNLRSCEQNATDLRLVASDGRSFTLTRAAVRANFLTQTGTVAQRTAKTVAWIRDQIEANLGAEQVPGLRVTRCSFRTADGDVNDIEFS